MASISGVGFALPRETDDVRGFENAVESAARGPAAPMTARWRFAQFPVSDESCPQSVRPFVVKATIHSLP